jgi:AraC-like DNA-binding protein
MPSSTVRSFTEPGEYGRAIRGGTIEMFRTTRGRFAAKLTKIDLHQLWMQRFCENLPRLAHIIVGMDRACILFRTQEGPSLQLGGMEIQPSDIVRLSHGLDSFMRSSGNARFGAMSLPVEAIVAVGEAICGCDLTPPSTINITPPPSAMQRLQRLHAAAGALAEDAPKVIANPDSARGLEQSLTEAMVECLVPQNRAEDSSARRRHETIMRRFHAAIADHPDEAIYISEVCAAVGVPQRTLNVCCHESLGVGPKRFLLLRRMNLARQALHEASHGSTTVTEIATSFGFWNFGRFAVEYRALFGETPSATLHRPP